MPPSHAEQTSHHPHVHTSDGHHPVGRALSRVADVVGHLLGQSATRYWAGLALAALLGGVALSNIVGRAEAVRERWGDTRAVLVTRTELRAGDRVGAGEVVVATWPVSLVPRSSLSSPEDLPNDARTVRAVAAGVPITPLDVIRQPGSPETSHLQVVIPADRDMRPALAPGDVVTLALPDATLAAGYPDAGPGRAASTLEARVVGSTDATLTVGIARSDGPALAAGLLSGRLVVMAGSLTDPRSPSGR